MLRQGVLAARGVGRCMLVLALTGVVDSTSPTGGRFIHPSTVRCFRDIHLHAPSSYLVFCLADPCCLIRSPTSSSLALSWSNETVTLTVQ